MTSKTFENVHTEYGGSMIVREEGDCVSVSINMVNPSDTSIHIAPSDAPALALAILEAAGFDGDETMFTGLAVANLRDHVEEQERATAEAEAQAKLEAEALELYRTFYCSDASWLDVFKKETWLAVARRAREMAKEATK